MKKRIAQILCFRPYPSSRYTLIARQQTIRRHRDRGINDNNDDGTREVVCDAESSAIAEPSVASVFGRRLMTGKKCYDRFSRAVYPKA